MQRDVHFDSDTHAHVVRVAASSGPASDHIEIDDARFLFSAHFKKSGPDLILTGDDGRKLVVTDSRPHSTTTPPMRARICGANTRPRRTRSCCRINRPRSCLGRTL